jgi:hypothetical protein
MTMRRRGRVAGALVVSTMILSSASVASGKDECLTSPVEGQKLRKAGKLLSARERFVGCAQKQCPEEVIADCTRWLAEVDGAIPSIVIAAKDANGVDLADASVSIDGAPFAPISDHALRLDPGAHEMTVRTATNETLTRQARLREGERERQILFTFGGAAGAAPAPSPSPGSDSPATLMKKVPTVALVAGGVGAAAFVSFAVFGALGVSARDSNNCDVGCSASDKSDVDTKFLIADVSLVVAVVGLGFATWVTLTRPSWAVKSGANAAVSWRPAYPFALGLRF